MAAVESRAIRFHEVGEPLDVLREDQTQIADPSEARIRGRMAATELNPADWELCRGFMPGALPRGIGYDVAGTVDAIGDESTMWRSATSCSARRISPRSRVPAQPTSSS